MMSLPGLRGRSRLQAGREVLQTPTDDDRCQQAKQYWPISRASNKMATMNSTCYKQNHIIRKPFMGLSKTFIFGSYLTKMHCVCLCAS